MRVDIDRMIKETEGVDNIRGLAEFLTAKGVDVSERTLYRWKKGGSIGKPKLMATAEVLGMELWDILILREMEDAAAEMVRCLSVTDEDIDSLHYDIADDEQKAFLKERKDELTRLVTASLLENHFMDALGTEVQDMLHPADSNGKSLK